MPYSQYNSCLCLNKTVSVVNINSKIMLQMFETSFVFLKQRLLVALDKRSSGNKTKNQRANSLLQK